MVYGALKFCDHARARILKIDTGKAAKMPGVLRVFTAADIPGERLTGLIVADWPLMIAAGETSRSGADVLAGVVAVKRSRCPRRRPRHPRGLRSPRAADRCPAGRKQPHPRP